MERGALAQHHTFIFPLTLVLRNGANSQVEMGSRRADRLPDTEHNTLTSGAEACMRHASLGAIQRRIPANQACSGTAPMRQSVDGGLPKSDKRRQCRACPSIAP